VFFGGDVQYYFVRRGYFPIIVVCLVDNNVLVSSSSIKPNSVMPAINEGTYLIITESTLDMAFQYHIIHRNIDKKRTIILPTEPDCAIDRILKGDTESKAIIWPPLSYLASSTGKGVLLDDHSNCHRWKVIMYAKNDSMPIFQGFYESFLYAWYTLRIDNVKMQESINK
jgi:hypothetical protein